MLAKMQARTAFSRAATPKVAVRVAPVTVSTRRVAVRSLAADAEEWADDVDLPSTGDALTVTSDKARLRIRMRSYEVGLLAECVGQIQSVADATGAVFRGPVMLPTRKKVFCVLRSPHVDKDAREHFEIKTHHRLVDLQNLSAETLAAMMSWVPPSGVEVECSIA